MSTGKHSGFVRRAEGSSRREASRQELVNRRLFSEQKNGLFGGEFADARTYFEELDAKGPRQITKQDLLLAALREPSRLLELVDRYTLLDGVMCPIDGGIGAPISGASRQIEQHQLRL